VKKKLRKKQLLKKIKLDDLRLAW